MAKLNTVKSNFRPTADEDVAKMWKRPDATPNMEGGLAFKMDAYNELVTRVASCFFGEPKFYQAVDDETGIIQAQNQEDDLIKLAQAVAMQDPQFVLQLAAYARNELYLRTVPVVLWTEVAILHGLKKIPAELKAGELVRKYGPAILKRADEPQEAIAYYIAKNGSFLGDGGRYPQFARKGAVLPNAMRKGIEDSIFRNFDHHKLSKYNRKKAAVKVKDTINLVHPNPNGNSNARWMGGAPYWSAVFKSVLEDTLPPAETWEDNLMRWKEKGYESKKDAWEAIIPKMGYMALLRNLRNIIEAGIHPTLFETVVAKLKNSEEVKKSKQFPFRFYTAYRTLEHMSVTNSQMQQKAMAALEDAMEASLNNLPRWTGKTAVVADFSGSMGAPLSDKSSVSLREVAALFMVMSAKMCEQADCYVFANTLQQVTIHERSGILDNVQRLLQISVGGATNAYLAMADFIQNQKVYDRCILFSDLQCYNVDDKDRVSRDEGNNVDWNGSGWYYHGDQIAPLWNRYKRIVSPNAYLYSIDLAGYGTSVVPVITHNLFLGGGFSDRILEFIPMYENQKKQSLVDRIKSVSHRDYLTERKERIERTFTPKSTATFSVDEVNETEESDTA